MLEELDVPYRYREYLDEPLTEDELRNILGKLEMAPRELLRPREANTLEISDDLADDELIERMAAAPTLVQRPIALLGDRALLARPADELRAFVNQ